MAVVLPLQKDNESENGEAPGEQADIAPCLHGNAECSPSEQEGSRATAEHAEDDSAGESPRSVEQEGALKGSGFEEQPRVRSAPDHQCEPAESNEVKDGRLSNNGCDGTASNAMQDLELPSEVRGNPSNTCEGNSSPTAPPGVTSPTALDPQEGLQGNQMRSIVVPMEGSGNESFEVILCGGEMEAPIPVMEAPARPTSRKGKRKSKGEVTANGDGSQPSKSSTVLQPSVEGVEKRRKGEVAVNGSGSLPSKSVAVPKQPVKGVGKKKKQRLPWRLDAKEKKSKRKRSEGKHTQEPEPGATNSEEMSADVFQCAPSAAPSQQPPVLLPFSAPSQAAHGTSQVSSSDFQFSFLISTTERKSKLVPSKRAKSWQAADSSRLDKMAAVLTADPNEVEVFSAATESQPLSVPRRRAKGGRTNRTKQRT